MAFAPLGILFAGYGLAAALAGAFLMLGAPVVTGILIVWLGGAAATLALAVVPASRRFFASRPATYNPAADGTLAAWRRDAAEETTAVNADRRKA